MNTLIEQADIALYQAKHAGKNQIQFSRDEALGPLDGRRLTKTKQLLATSQAERVEREHRTTLSEAGTLSGSP